MNKIVEYFLNKKKEREERARLKKAANRFKEDQFSVSTYKKAMKIAEKMSNEEAIQNAISEIKYYNKAKLIESKVRLLLQSHRINEPDSFSTSDSKLKEAIYVLDVKGLELPKDILTKPQITEDEIRAGLLRACIEIQAQMQYYDISQEEINKVVKKFQDITAKEIKDGNYPKASKDSDSIAKRYYKTEIFHNSQEER